jgi:hypothetical protein
MELASRTAIAAFDPIRLPDAGFPSSIPQPTDHDDKPTQTRRLSILLMSKDRAFADDIQRTVLLSCDRLAIGTSLADCIRSLQAEQFDGVFVELRTNDQRTFDVGHFVRQQCAWRRPFMIGFVDERKSSQISQGSRANYDLLFPIAFDAKALSAVLTRLRSVLASIDSFDPMI